MSEVLGSLDPSSEGSEVLGRAREILVQWEALGHIVAAPGTPFDAAATPAIAELRAMLDRSAPLLARMRRAPMLPSSEAA